VDEDGEPQDLELTHDKKEVEEHLEGLNKNTGSVEEGSYVVLEFEIKEVIEPVVHTVATVEI